MHKVFIVTNRYPYGAGEEFFESEMPYWADEKNVQITVLPITLAAIKRETPANVEVDDSLGGVSRLSKIFFAVAGVFSPYFLKDFFYLFKSKKINKETLRALIVCCATTARVKDRLGKFIEATGRPDLVYTYWNESASYGVCLLKRMRVVPRVISRAHNYDLYEEGRPSQFMPLKRQFSKDYDLVFPLTANAREYLIKHYGFPFDVVKVCSLGVDLPGISRLSRRDNKKFSVLSLSHCNPQKRIDKIVGRLFLFCKSNPALAVSWTHMGGGVLLSELVGYAKEKFSGLSNIKHSFLGSLPNAKVKEILVSERFDVIVNASESEGVPVSLMEAMSFGVPAIAPTVGEVPYLVNKKNGVLMSSEASTTEIRDALNSIAYAVDHESFEKEARATIELNFSAKKNYREFVQAAIQALPDSR